MYKVGNLVLAKAGKEKGQMFVIVALDGRYAYLADGDRLKRDKPKKKSFKHIKPCGNETLDEQVLLDKNDRVNSAIRKFIKLKGEVNVKG